VRILKNPAVALVLIALLAGVTRFWALGDPGTDDKGKRVYVFDETYYAKDGCLYAGFKYQKCDLTSNAEQSWVHPPLGKWMIAAGIKLFGNNPLGARVSAAFFGTASVVLLALLALLLFRNVLWCYVAGILGAAESLNLVQSRVALLDIFVAFWVVLGFVFVVLDRRWIDRRTPPPVLESAVAVHREIPTVAHSLGPGAMASSEPITDESGQPFPQRRRRRVPSPFWRPWRFAAGIAFGAAFATKWNGFPALIGALGLMVIWEITRRLEPDGMPLWEVALSAGVGVLLLAGGFAFGGAVGDKWSVVPALVILLLLVIPALAVRRAVSAADEGGSVLGGMAVLALFGEGLAIGAAYGGKLAWPVPIGGLIVALIILFAHDEHRRRREGRRNPLADMLERESLPLILAMVVLPLVVYAGSYTGHFGSTSYGDPRYQPGLEFPYTPSHLSKLLHVTGDMARFHEHLFAENPYTDPDTGKVTYTPAHPYQSRPWEWLYLGRPVSYYFVGEGTEILAIGNPAIFWFSFLAIPWLAFAIWRRRDWRAGLILVAILAQYLPWFIPPALNKVQFFFYATPIAPFLVLAATYTVRDFSAIHVLGSRSRPLLPVAVGYVVVAVALFAWFWPVLTAMPLSHDWWNARIWSPRWI
jgi:dolichyl-phosphate-mannose-protein mannosyltransferase